MGSALKSFGRRKQPFLTVSSLGFKLQTWTVTVMYITAMGTHNLPSVLGVLKAPYIVEGLKPSFFHGLLGSKCQPKNR